MNFIDRKMAEEISYRWKVEDQLQKLCIMLIVHNEEKLIPYSLPSIIQVNPKEIRVILDRCTDRTEQKSLEIANKFGYKNLKIHKINEESNGWKCRISYLRYIGSHFTNLEYVMFTSADLMLDKKAVEKGISELNEKMGFVSFLHFNYPMDVANLLKRLAVSTGLRGFGRNYFIGGAYVWNRKAGLKLEDPESLKKVESAEDTHLLAAMSKQYNSKCFASRTYHVRPRGKPRAYLQGRLSWSVVHRSFFTVFVKAIFLLQFEQIKGYIHERFKS